MRKVGALFLSLTMVILASSSICLGALDTPSAIHVAIDMPVPQGRTVSREVDDLIEISNGLPASGSYTTAYFVNLNGDGFLDIAACSWGMGGVQGCDAFTSNNGNSWSAASTGLPTTGSYGLGAVADIDNDLNIDIIVPHEADNSAGATNGIEIWLGNGGAGGSVQWTQGVDPINTSSFDGVAAADVDGDGNVDIAASKQSNGGLQFWTGNGGSGWVESSTGLPSAGGYHGMVFADVNEDGSKDIIVGVNNGIEIFTNDGDNTWTANNTGLPTGMNVWNLRVADLDHDDDLDIVAATDLNGVRVYTGNGGSGGSFQWTLASNGLVSDDYYEAIDVGNVDQDGNLDILTATDSTNHGIKLYLGNGGDGGTLSWTRIGESDLPITNDYYAADIGDFNSDGAGDLLMGGAGNGIRVWKTIAPLSDPPIADAGDYQSVWIDTLVTLNGSASSDDTGLALYDWNMTSRPGGSTAALDSETVAMPTFTTDEPGDYVFTLAVKDIDDQWALNEATVTINAKIFPNAFPIAVAGVDQTVTIFDTVQLDGSNSTDDAGIKAYDWNITTEPEESSVEFSDETAIKPTFTPEYIGEYRITLTVQDINDTWANEDQVVVNVMPVGEYPPYANAGTSETIELGDSIVLNGTGSSDDIGIEYYGWTVISEPPGSNLVVQQMGQPVITPTVLGIYQFELKVKDTDNLWSDPDQVMVTVVPKNLDPEAIMNMPLDGAEYLTIEDVPFDASDSTDPENDPLTFKWESSIDGFLSVEESFDRNLSKGQHTITLTVKDDHNNGASVTAIITVKEDLFPMASLSANVSLVLKDQKVSFDGSGSSDPEGVVFEYYFDFGDGKDSRWIKMPKTTHSYSNPGLYSAILKVKDSIGQVSKGSPEVLIRVGESPVADLVVSAEQVLKKKAVQLDASGSTDGDGNVVAYHFDFGDKANSGWMNESSVTHSYDKPGRYTVTLKVRDDHGFESGPAKVTITVKAPEKKEISSDLTLPLILIVIIVVITVVVLMLLKKRTATQVAQKEKEAREAAMPKQDFSDVDALMSQQAQPQPYPDPSQQGGYDQQQQGGYDQQQQGGYDQQQGGYDQQQQQGYDQQQQQGYDQGGQYQYPPQGPDQGT